MTGKLAAILDELRQGLKDLYGPRLVQVVLFGSQARGDAVFGSDIDVMVVLAGEVDPIEEIHRTSHLVAGLSLKYDEVLSCVFVGQEELAFENDPFLREVQREGVAL
jgi:predicted nucleotidyltransferase